MLTVGVTEPARRASCPSGTTPAMTFAESWRGDNLP